HTSPISTLPLHDALPIFPVEAARVTGPARGPAAGEGVHDLEPAAGQAIQFSSVDHVLQAPRGIEQPHGGAGSGWMAVADHRHQRDRKSTRLNSSHRTISY